MVTGNLLQGARIIAGLSAADLAARAGLDVGIVETLEAAGRAGVAGQERTVGRVLAALRAAGVEVRLDDGPSLRILPATVDEGMRPEALNAGNDD